MKNKGLTKRITGMMILVTVCLLIVMLFNVKDVYASGSDYIYNGVDYSSVFDYDYYYKMYPDLQKAYGYNKELLFKHFINSGMKEGRIARQCFDVKYYKNKYLDLQKSYGDDLTKYYLHYIKNGIKEKRIGASDTVYLNVDYSSVYNADYYYKTYADIQKAYGYDKEKLIAHFVNNGMKEGRRGCATFDVKYYKYANEDLQKAYGSEMNSYYLHYIRFGNKEKRKGYSNSFYNGIDYSDVYNVDFYYNNYKDLQKAFGYDSEKLIAHFVKSGMSEGRQASLEFSVSYYKNKYGDLQKAYGTDLTKYYIHYMNYGKKEGRIANVQSNYNGWNVVNGQKLYYVNGQFVKGWQTINGRKYYFSSSGILQSQFGIDVSSYQGIIDWEKAKKDGVEFAIIRIGYGNNIEKQDDIYAERNMSECERLGIPYGVYLFSYALDDSDLTSEINHTLRLIKGHNPTIGVFFDCENDPNYEKRWETIHGTKFPRPTPEKYAEFAVNFNEAMIKNGYKSGTYTYNYFWDTQLYSPLLNKYPKWLADYTKGFYPSDDTYFIWQYTSSGIVDGISGNVDMNVYIPSWR